MKVFIDFDDVIFNTKQFKDDLKNIFLEFGVSNELYEQTYYNQGDSRVVRVYDPLAQIERIKSIHDINEGGLIESIGLFMDSAEKYVFPDVDAFVSSCGKDNIYVISYGDVKFQEEKIKSSKIARHMESIFVTDELKAKTMEKVIEEKNITNKEKIFFLDDRVEQISNVKEKFPQIISILVKRPAGRYQDTQKSEYCNYEVSSLEEAQEIISKL